MGSFSHCLSEYSIAVLYCNLLSYFLSTLCLFVLLFSFDIRLVKTLSDIKNIKIDSFSYSSIFLSVFSLAGIPPLVGFSGKFSLVTLMTSQSSYVAWTYIIVFSLFSLYFYISLFKHFQSKKSKSKVLYVNNWQYFNYNLFTIGFLCLFSITFGSFFFQDMLIVAYTVLLS